MTISTDTSSYVNSSLNSTQPSYGFDSEITLHNLALNAELLSHASSLHVEKLVQATNIDGVICTHRIGNIIGPKATVTNFYKSLQTIESKSPTFYRLIKGNLKSSRCLTVVIDNGSLVNQGIGGAWGPFSGATKELQKFRFGIAVERDSKRIITASRAAHEWVHEWLSQLSEKLFNNPMLCDPCRTSQDVKYLTETWFNSYNDYIEKHGGFEIDSPGYIMYKKPAKYFKKWQHFESEIVELQTVLSKTKDPNVTSSLKQSIAKLRKKASAAAVKFRAEIPTHFMESKIVYGSKGIEKAGGKHLGLALDKICKNKMFTEASKKIPLKMLGRYSMKSLPWVLHGIDLSHNFYKVKAELIETDGSYRKGHAAIRSGSRFLSNLALFHTNPDLLMSADESFLEEKEFQQKDLDSPHETNKRSLFSAAHMIAGIPIGGGVAKLPPIQFDLRPTEESLHESLKRDADNIRHIEKKIADTLCGVYDKMFPKEDKKSQYVAEQITMKLGDPANLPKDFWEWSAEKQAKYFNENFVIKAKEVMKEAMESFEAMDEPLKPTVAVTERSLEPANHVQTGNTNDLQQLIIETKVLEQGIDEILSEHEKDLALEPTKELVLKEGEQLKKTDNVLNKTEEVCRKEEIFNTAIGVAKGLAECVYLVQTERAQSKAFKRNEKTFEYNIKQQKRNREFRKQFQFNLSQFERMAFDQTNPINILKTTSKMKETYARLENNRERISEELEYRRNLNTEIASGIQHCEAHKRRLKDLYKDKIRELKKLKKGLAILRGWFTLMSYIPHPVTKIIGMAGSMGTEMAGGHVYGKMQKESDKYQKKVLNNQETINEFEYVNDYNRGRIFTLEDQQTYEILNFVNKKYDMPPEEYRNGLKERLDNAREKQKKLDNTLASSESVTLKISQPMRCILNYIEGWLGPDARDKWNEGYRPDDKTIDTFDKFLEQYAMGHTPKLKKGKKEESFPKIEEKKQEYWTEFGKQTSPDAVGSQSQSSQNLTPDMAATKAKAPDEKNKADSHRENVLQPLEDEYTLEEAIAPIRDAFHERIQKEVDRWESIGETEEETKLKNNKRQEIENLWRRWHQSRGTERYLVEVFHVAAKGLANEMDFYTGTNRFGIATELASHGYKLYDLGKNIETALAELGLGWDKISEAHSIGGLQGVASLANNSTFKKALDKGGLAEVIKDIGGPVVFVTQYLVPSIQVITTTASIIRLGYAFYKGQPGGLSPEQEFYLETLNRAFKDFHKYVSSRFDELEKTIGVHHEELQKNITTLKNDLVDVAEEIIIEVRETAKETQAVTIESHYADFVREIQNKKQKIKSLSVELEGKQLGQFNTWIGRCSLPQNNGFSKGRKDCGSGVKRYPNTFFSYTKRNPEYFTGLYGDIVGVEGTVPSLTMYRELALQFLKFKKKDLSKLKDHDGFKKTLCTLVERGKQLQLLFRNLLPLVQKAVKSRSVIENLLANNQQKIADLRQELSKGPNLTLEELKKKKTAMIGKEFVGDGKYLLSKIVCTTPISTNSTYDLYGKHIRKQAITAGKATAAGATCGATVGGFLVASAGGGLKVIAASVLSAPFAAFALGMGGAAAVISIGASTINSMRKEASEKTFFSRLDSEIVKVMKLPIHELIKKHKVSNDHYLTKSAPTIADDSTNQRLSIKSVFKSSPFRYSPRLCYETHSGMNICIGKIKAGDKQSKVNQYLIKYKTRISLNDLTIGHVFKNNSILKREDVERIVPVNLSGYNRRVKKLMTHFYDLLQYHHCGVELSQDNVFRSLIAKSEKIPSMNPELPTLFFPKSFIEYLASFHKLDGEKMSKLGAGALVPMYDFVQSADERTWTLQIHFWFKENTLAQPKQNTVMEVAKFDRQTVDAFRKGETLVIKERDKDERHEYRQGKLNLSEFLIQMMYSGFVKGIGLPGSQSYTVKQKGWVAPVDREFVGAYKIWEAASKCRIHYTSSNYTIDVKKSLENVVSKKQLPAKCPLLKKDPIINSGRDQLTIWRKVRSSEKSMLKEHKKKYQERYDLLIAATRLISGVDHETLEFFLQDRLKLVPPSKLNEMLEFPEETPQFGTPETVARFLQKVPSVEKKELEQLVAKLTELKRACGMNVVEDKKSKTSSSYE